MVGKVGRAVTSALGLGDPQLRRLHGAAPPAARIFGVGDALSGRHQVELARPDHLPVTQAVGVLHLSLQHPGDRVQADVRVRADSHGVLGADFGRTEVVEEAPGAHHAPDATGQCPVDGEATDFRRDAVGDNGARCRVHRLTISHGPGFTPGASPRRKIDARPLAMDRVFTYYGQCLLLLGDHQRERPGEGQKSR